MHGNFFWYDVMTTDTKAGAKFYADVIGWGVQDSGAPGAGRMSVTAGLLRLVAAAGGDRRFSVDDAAVVAVETDPGALLFRAEAAGEFEEAPLVAPRQFQLEQRGENL